MSKYWGPETPPDSITPSKEEQAFLILQGKCPHNEGWTYEGPHHDDYVYKCRKCKDLVFY